jgi:IS6 family transposase
MPTSSLFKRRHFAPEVIVCGVRWYLRYALSYRDVEELLRERGVAVDHTTIFRWVQRYAPELDKRCRPYLTATNDSYRVDETYIKIKKGWYYLYRAVDSELDFVHLNVSNRPLGPSARVPLLGFLQGLGRGRMLNN